MCSNCNNYFGSHYASEFTPFYNELANFFKNNYDALINESSNGDLNIDIKANINFFKFEKQVVSMLMSTSRGIYKNFFKEYLLDENNTNFPTDKFKIIMNGYLNFEVSRITEQMIGVDLVSNSPQIVGSEIQVFPLGFTLIELNNSNKEKILTTD